MSQQHSFPPPGSYAPYGSAASAPQYGYYGGGTPPPPAAAAGVNGGSGGGDAAGASLRRRTVADQQLHASPGGDYGANGSSSGSSSPSGKYKGKSNVVKRLDFMFPKVDTEFTVKTERGGLASLMAYSIIFILVIAEVAAWFDENHSSTEHVMVDTSLGKRMRVNINITFPGLACEDLHVDVMDVAGDSHLNVEEQMLKRRFDLYGRPLGAVEIAKSNTWKQKQEARERTLKKELPPDYCGPCYGAHEKDDQCCNTCDELLEAYKKKKWMNDLVLTTSEQCVREGRDRQEPKRMSKGEGCNLSGIMTLNRVAGNFHIAMGEGIERNGRHIHSFVPEDTPNFNASHIIHHLSFGSADVQTVRKDDQEKSLNGVSKIVTKEHGTTGLFQYFIKVVPTAYVSRNVKTGEKIIQETNRYFFTERFRPLMKEYLDDDTIVQPSDENNSTSLVSAGTGGGHSKAEHHDVRNAVLPGVFFIYEIYPFAVEIEQTFVPWTHLLIRIMATVGGVFTLVKWLDTAIFERNPTSSGGSRQQRRV